MGLFGGDSKSYSTSTTLSTSDVSTQNSSLSGVVSDAPLLTGSNINYTESFSGNVAGAFNSLIDLTGEVIKGLQTNSEKSLAGVIEANQQVQNPAFNALADTSKKLVPLAMYAILAYAAVRLLPIIMKKG